MSNETQTRLKPHRGIFVFTFGILSFISGFFAIVFGPIAWISGRRDLKEMNTGVMNNSDGGLTQAGQVLGMIMTIFWALVLILGLLGLGIVALLVPSGDHFEDHGVHDTNYYDEGSADAYGEEMMMDEYGH